MPKSLLNPLFRCAVPFLLLALIAPAAADRSLVPASIRDAILNEFSGELALRHVEILSVDRNRQAGEYEDRFMETAYMTRMAGEYGLSDVKVDFFPSGEIWDAEEAELWLVEPVKKKLAGLEIIPEALASGSASADVQAELVYVGAARDQDFEGKEVAGKILLTSGSPTGAFNAGVLKRGAAGVLGTGSPGASLDAPGYSREQIGWHSVSPGERKQGFGFVLSRRQFDELRNLLDRGQKVVLRAVVKSRMYPYKMNVVSAAIPGSDPEAGELLYVAHLFERIPTPGANDNCSGVANALEIGRTLAKLIRKGDLPPPQRTIRFLWVPEISGSREFMYKYPELEDRLMAVINFDMTGADPKTTDTYLRMKMTPDSVPSYLNDLIANLLLTADQTSIATQWGGSGPFNYRLCPYIAGSDHTVFLPAGIPAMQFNYWPDNFYHSSEDRSRHVDPTELKRTGFVSAAAFYWLAVAGGAEAKALAWECSANGEKWLAEVSRQSARLLTAKPEVLHERHKAAQVKVDAAFERARRTVESVRGIAAGPDVSALVRQLIAGLQQSRDTHKANLEYLYREKCSEAGVEPRAVALTEEEQKYARLVPRRLHRIFSQDYRAKSARLSEHLPREGARLPALAASEVAGFVDGKRSILDIYNAVRAEYGHVNTSSNDFKFAYVVTADTPDIELKPVVDYLTAMEKAGLIAIDGVRS